jgi:phage tail-like protein
LEEAVATRPDPYGAFNFMVKLGDSGGEDQITGGFSDVSGLGNEVKYSEYRNGNEMESHVRKIPNTNTTDDVTLKRGVIGDLSLFAWLKATREGTINKQTVTITLLDEARSPVCRWVLQAAQPKKWVGPTLAGKGGGEVAMEELHLVAESIDFQSA